MRLLMLLLHDERFSGWSVRERLTRHHFSLRYLELCRGFGWNPSLYCFHQSIREMRVYRSKRLGTIKIFPVRFRFPPFLRFGNDHNPTAVWREMLLDLPDLVHFHHYYLFSFPYTAWLVKRRLKRPLTTQLHGYYHPPKRWMFWPCLLMLRRVDRILYSYKPEESLYRRLGVLDRAHRIPFPGVDPSLFQPGRRRASDRLLCVGRIPLPGGGERFPHLLLPILRNLLRHRRELTLTFVGDGPGLAHCRWLASRLGVWEHVSFDGYVPHAELPRYYQTSLMTLVPLGVYDVDGWFDGVIQESLACGTPVVAFKAYGKGGKGTFGYLLTKDPNRAADELLTLLDALEEVEELAEKGSRFIHAHCMEGRIARELRDVWEGLVKG